MGAIYGIVGDADIDEVRRLGARLHHRGADARAWSLSPVVHLGVRGTASAVRSMEDGIVAFDGALDNRADIARFLQWPARATVTPDDDSMLVLELVATFGTEALAQLAGQFAFALWDGPSRQLVLGRDHIGYAPLYFALDRGRLIFASEYKALLAIDEFPARPNHDALQTIHATTCVLPGATCLAGVHPVAPGSVLVGRPGRIASTRYWQVPIRVTHDDSARDTDGVRRAFLDTIRRQTESYDCIGVSLGGLASAIVATGVRLTAPAKELHTFTGGYGVDDREFVHAELVAKTLGTYHHPFILEAEELPDLLPLMVWLLEEPIGRDELVYLYAAAREARKHVNLILTGFGIDDLFAGLPRRRGANLTARLPLFRRALDETLPSQSGVERLYAGCGLPFNAHHTDPSFIATAVSIPNQPKIHGRRQQHILRQAFSGLVPDAVLQSPKRVNRLRHDLRLSQVLDVLADDLLSDAAVADRGLFEPAYVHAVRRRPISKAYHPSQTRRLWSLLLTEMWSRIFLDTRGAAPVGPGTNYGAIAAAVDARAPRYAVT